MNLHKRMHHMLWLIVPCLLQIFTLRFSGEIQFYLFLSVGTDAQWNCQVRKKMEIFIFKHKGCLTLTRQQNTSPQKQKMSNKNSVHPCEHGALLLVLVVDKITPTAVMISDTWYLLSDRWLCSDCFSLGSSLFNCQRQYDLYFPSGAPYTFLYIETG